MAKKTGKNNLTNPSKKAEFEAFIEMIRGDTIAHWVQIAEVLGVDRTTIAEWRKHPLAQKAIRDGIEKSMEGMLKAGKNDWKMWESRMKMLGISPIEKQDVTSKGEKVVGFIYQAPVKEEPPKVKPKKKSKVNEKNKSDN